MQIIHYLVQQIHQVVQELHQGSAGDSPRTSHSFEPVKEPVNEPIAVGASADESVRVRSNRPEYSPEFEQAWLAYPKRAGGNSKSAAFKAWKARLNEG